MASIDLVNGTGVTFTVPRSVCRLGHSSLSQLVYAHPQPSMGQTDSPVFVWSSLAGHFFGDESRSCSAVFVEHLYQIWLRQQHVGSSIAKIFSLYHGPRPAKQNFSVTGHAWPNLCEHTLYSIQKKFSETSIESFLNVFLRGQ